MFILIPLLVVLSGLVFILKIDYKIKTIASFVVQIFAFVMMVFVVLLYKNRVEIKNISLAENFFANQTQIQTQNYTTLAEKSSQQIFINYPKFIYKTDKSLFNIAFYLDKYSVYLSLMIIFLWIFATLYTIEYMKNLYKDRDCSVFMVFYHISIASALFCVFSANIFTMFIFY